MPKYYRIQDVSREVSRYIAQKNLRASPNGWRDVYAQEHAAAFTVAKLKDLNLLGSVQKEIAHSIEHGDTFKDFQKRMQPKLQSWLDSVCRPPPKEIEALEGPELDKWKAKKDRYRLRRIFETNTKQAYSQHYYQRGMNNEFVSHVIYRIGPSINHRADHVALDGLVLPKTHPMWDSHWPPNGWNCKCYVRFITKRKLEGYRKNGVPDLQSADPKTGRFTRNKRIFETAPPTRYRWFSRDHGLDVAVPADIDPGFEWNPGKFNRGTWLKDQALRKARALELESKKLDKIEKQIVNGDNHTPSQVDLYKAFVDQVLESQSTNGKTSGVGLISKEIQDEAQKKGLQTPATRLALIQDNIITSKNEKHKNHKEGDSSLTSDEFKMLPDILEKPDSILWDSYRKNYILTRGSVKKRPLLVILNASNMQRRGDLVWEIRSFFRHTKRLDELLNEETPTGQKRYQIIKK